MRTATIGSIIFFCGLGLGLTTAGCGEMMTAGECEMEEGTYIVEVVDAGGSCGSDYADSISGTKDIEYDEESDLECGPRSDVETGSFVIDGAQCTATTSYTGEVTSDGPQDFSREDEIVCDGQTVCIHEFNLYFEKR